MEKEANEWENLYVRNRKVFYEKNGWRTGKEYWKNK